nr:leucine-rich repeat domain-containing protein [Pseudoflavonifractor phocaeensis]
MEQYNGPGGDVVIPEGVTEIGYPAFRNCTSLTSIVIPKTVVQLNKFAFSGCTGLTKVEIAPGNKCFHIENGLVIAPKRRTLLFALSGLTSAVLPASVTIPEGIVKIECYAFVECASLTDVTIPASVAKIESFAFEGCNTLEKITILGKPEIGKKAFPASVAAIVAEQLRMEDYTVPANKQAAARGFALRYAAGEALPEDYRADCLKYIKSRKKKLYPAALQDPALLHVMLGEKIVPKVDLPDLIEQAAALGSAEITAMLLAYQEQQLKPGEREQREEKKTQREMDFLLTGTLTAAEAKKSWRYGKDKEGNLWILGYKGRETQVEVPAFIGKDKVVGIDRAAFNPDAHRLTEAIRTMRREITGVRLPETIVTIGGYAFQNCTALASVTLSEGIRKIGPCAFQDCTSLTSVTLPDSVQEIGGCAFAGCTSLASVTIPEGVAKIDGCAFGSCASLTSVTLPASVKEMEQDVFWRCKGRVTIHAPAGSYAEQYAQRNNIRFEEA